MDVIFARNYTRLRIHSRDNPYIPCFTLSWWRVFRLLYAATKAIGFKLLINKNKPVGEDSTDLHLS